MNLNDLKKNWDQFGIDDPYWSILTDPSKKGNKWNEKDFFESGSLTIDKEVKQLKRRQPDFTFHSALDFGCGAGRLTQGLAEHFDTVSGVDIAPSMIALAKEKNKKQNCRYYLNDKNDLSIFGDEEFDFIYSLITLQHMEPKYAKNYIVEFLRVLKPNGFLKFQIPSKPDTGSKSYHRPLNKISRKLNLFTNRQNKDSETPIMEMYWIPIEEMVKFLVKIGAQISHIKKNDSAGEEWDSYTYSITKPPKNN